jgi:hypothetical protein
MVQFEEAIASSHSGCVIHTFDPTVNRLKLLSGYYGFPAGANYHYIGIGAAPETFYGSTGSRRISFLVNSLNNIMDTLNHPYLDILKIDVEGSEWGLIDAMAKTGFPDIGHLLVEVHLTDRISPEKEWPDVVRLVERIEAAGFRLVHKTQLWSGPNPGEKSGGQVTFCLVLCAETLVPTGF